MSSPPPKPTPCPAPRAMLLASLLLLAACGGSGGGGSPAPTPAPTPPPPPPPPAGLVRVSPPSIFATGCNGAQTGTLFPNTEVEPYVAVNPLSPGNLVGVWQQDRWSNGGSQGTLSAVSFDAGATWSVKSVAFSRCAGGTAANGGDFDRASDPWVTFSPNGAAYQMALSFTGDSFSAGSSNALLVSRSADGGVTWSPTVTLIRDGSLFFNDKGSITADPRDARFVYATWDRLALAGGGPAMLARTVDGGTSWTAAVPIYDPGPRSQTLGNQIVVLPDGTAVDLFTQIDFAAVGPARSSLVVIRSSDRGVTWSVPVKVADLLAIGTRDPETSVAVRDAASLAEIAVDPLGNLHVVWQDARFSGGVHDDVAFARSTDGGATWSVPVRVNGAATVPAFVPTVRVRADGTIGVLYYDLRDNTPDPTTLLTDTWLARSADGGRTWTESRIAGPFDLANAPRTDGGYFLGDYQALAVSASNFVPFFAIANTGDTANRTDIVVATGALVAREALLAEARPAAATDTPPSAEFAQRVGDAILRTMRARVPGWKPPVAPRT